jgi:hypothetical protein
MAQSWLGCRTLSHTADSAPSSAARPGLRPSPLLAGLILLLTLSAQPAAADFLGIPLERQPFIKFCPDGSIVGSLGPNLWGQSSDQYGAFAYDRRTDRTEFLRRTDDFTDRLAENPCVEHPVGREPD